MMDKKSSMLQILDLFTQEQKISHHHSDFLKYLSSLSLPIITSEKIDIFCKTIDETHDLLASLICFHDIFTFDPTILHKIISYNQSQNKDILKAAPFIYMNSIGFILSFTNSSTFSENFTIVLNSIFSLSYYDFKNSFFLYFFILEYFIENSSNLIQEDNIRLICSHICVQTKPNIKFYSILIEMLSKVSACEKCLDQIFPTFALVLQILSKKKIDIDISFLCDVVIQNLLNIKYQVFEVILVLSKRKEDNNVKKIYQLLPRSIKDFLIDKSFPFFEDLTNNIKNNPDINKITEQIEYQYTNSLSNIQCDGILESDTYPTIYDCSEFLDSFIQPNVYYLSLITNILPVDVKRSYLNSFMQSFEQLFTEPYDFNLFISFLFILSKIKCHFTLSTKMMDLLFNKTLFNPSITAFNSLITDYQKVFLLRNIIIRISFQFCKNGATFFFRKSENFPSIFTEMLLRSAKFDITKLFNDTFLNSFCKVYFELCEIDSKIESNSNKRSIFFQFMKFLLEIPSLPFHKLKTFSGETDHLINSMLSERSFQSTIFGQIRRLLTSTKYSEFSPSCTQVCNLVTLINQTTEDANSIKEYLQVFHECMQKNDCLKNSPSSVNLLGSFITFVEHHPNEETVCKLLKILSLYNKESIDDWVLHRLSAIVPVSLENGLNDEISFTIFSLVFAPSGQSFTNSIIENGNPLHLILSVYSFFGKTFDLLTIINSLCDYSTCNRIRLHKSEFDILLLDILIHYPSDFIFKGCKVFNLSDSYFDLLFEVFAKISVTKSNQIVTDRLMKVICHSKVSERFLKFFIPIENLTKKFTMSKYPLGIQQLYFEADNISEDTIKQGFSIAFWLFVDNPISEKLKIKATVLTGMNFFNLFICQSLLYLTDMNNNVLLTFPIRSHHWNAVIMNFHDDTLIIYVNRNFVTRKIKLTPLNSKNTFTFGNDIDNRMNIDELLSVYSIAHFAMYTKELTANEIEKFISQALELQPLYSFPIDLNNPPIQSATMYIDMNGYIPKLENIIDYLNYIYPIENIIPLFSQLHQFEHRILILNAIENIFQNKFNSISEIAFYLLNQNDQSIFNFDLYQAFYSFLKKSNENESLFDSLIVNCDLWSHSELNDLIQIVNHWKTVLFPEFEILFYRKKFFFRFLSELRILYLNKASNKDIDLAIQPCLDLIELIASHDFDDSRSCLFLETIIKSENDEFSLKLINILPNLLVKLSSNQITLRLVELLLSIDFDKYKKSIHSLIDSLSILSGSKFYHTTIILGYNISPDFDCKYFQDDLEQFPQLTFICLKAALKTTPENQNNLGNLILKIILNDDVKKMFLNFEMWFIWPSIFALETDEMEIMSLFIGSVLCSDFSKETVGYIFSFIDLLGVQTTFDVKEFKCTLIKSLFELLNIDIKSQKQLDLIELGFESLFSICSNDSISFGLSKEYQESPFNIDEFEVPKKCENKIYSLKDLEAVLELEFIEYSYFLQTINISHYSKLIKSFYHIYSSILQSVSEGVGYLHKLICSLSLYPDSNAVQSNDFLINGSKLLPFVKSLKKRTRNFAIQLKDFFKRIEKPLQEIESLKSSILDPLIDVYKEKENKFIINKKEWKRILKRFVHPNSVFDINCFEWERDFFITTDFVCNKIKRKIKTIKQNKYKYPFNINDIKIVNNENETKNNIKPKSSQNLQIKTNSSKNITSLTPSIISSYSCIRIKIGESKPVTFNLHDKTIEIISKKKTILIKLNKIRDIFTRSRYQKKTGIEFFLLNGKSYLFDFAPTLSIVVLKQLSTLEMPSLRTKENDDYSSFINNTNLLQKWQVGNMTTFDFLMNLNMSCGRSFNDSENYVIFPWVVASPGSKHLRNFDRPMPAQTDSRFNYYKKKVQLNNETQEMSNFLFGSAPSNAMLLSYYFVRMQPFVSLHLKVHDGKFDVMDRIFRSVDNFFSGMAASDDSRESVPEFYSLPEIFFDLDKININVKASNNGESDVLQTGVEKANEQDATTDQANSMKQQNEEAGKQDENQDKMNDYINDKQKDQTATNDQNKNQNQQNEEAGKQDENQDKMNGNINDKEKDQTATNDQNKNPKQQNEEAGKQDENQDKMNVEYKEQNAHNEEANKQDVNQDRTNENYKDQSTMNDESCNQNKDRNSQIEDANEKEQNQRERNGESNEQNKDQSTANEVENGKEENQSQICNESNEQNRDQSTSNDESRSITDLGTHDAESSHKDGKQNAVNEVKTEQNNVLETHSGGSKVSEIENELKVNDSNSAKQIDDQAHQSIDATHNTEPNTQTEETAEQINDSVPNEEDKITHKGDSTTNDEDSTRHKENPATLNTYTAQQTEENKSNSSTDALHEPPSSPREDEPSPNEPFDTQNTESSSTLQKEEASAQNDESDSYDDLSSSQGDEYSAKSEGLCDNESVSQCENDARGSAQGHPQPSDFIGDLEVPAWSNNNIYDFVYNLRRMLESDEVSDQLNKWIDLLFGLSQRGEEAAKRCNIYIPYIYDDVWKGTKPEDEDMIVALLRSLGSMPPIVFTEKVASKIIVHSPLQLNKEVSLEYDHQIRRGFPFMTSINKCHLIAINCNGCIERVSIDFNKNVKSINSTDNFLNPSDHIITLYHKMVVYIIDCTNSKVSSVSTDDKIITQKVQNLENVEFIDPGIYDHTFYTISKTGSVYLWSSNKIDSPQLIMSVFSDSLKAATVSQNFGVFVYATNNGFCEVYSLNNKRFVNSVYLDGFVGQKVVITPKLGLIVVKTLKSIWVLTINGFVIKKIPFLHHLNVWTMWSSNKGIDFISVSDSIGNVWCFEAYYPEKATIVKSCHDAIVGIEYDLNNNCLLIVTMKPKLHIVSI